MKVYKFRKYEEVFPLLYNNEKKRIGKIISKSTLIEHIGSTAVSGLPGKGIIDIMISCPKKEMTKVKNKLLKKRYTAGTSSDEDRIFLKREAKIGGKVRRFHIHITPKGHRLWIGAVSFKNYLIKNPKIAKQYAILKKKAINQCKQDGEHYRKLKEKFINYYTRKAKKEIN